MKRFVIAVGAAALMAVCLAGRAAAQNVWEKPYARWTKDDVEKIFNDSPWAKTREDRESVPGGVPFSVKVITRLRSALPVRQAVVRLNQLEARYDKMSDAEKAAFDARMRGLLECPACANNYVITMNSPITRGPGDDRVGILKNETLASLKPYVYLANDKGERRELVHFVAPKVQGDEATFFFPRLDEGGKPLVTPDSKKLILYLDPRVFERDRFPLNKVEFDVSKLLVNGEVVF